MWRVEKVTRESYYPRNNNMNINAFKIYEGHSFLKAFFIFCQEIIRYRSCNVILEYKNETKY
jgi:hypothetical protein